MNIPKFLDARDEWPRAISGSMCLRLTCALAVITLLTCATEKTAIVRAQSSTQNISSRSDLTPLQRAIERQRQRLGSSETEERRDAAMRLGWMRRAESSRAATSALGDTAAIVRATAAHAVLSLPADEAAQDLLPLLKDREEFVRRETAYALGETRSRLAVGPLVAVLQQDKLDSVRSAAVVALGMIGDESAVIPLSQALAERRQGSKKAEDVFVRRSAAHSLGLIKSRVAVPALIAALSDERAGSDVRREAALALGLIGDQSAVAALRSALTSPDPYLSRVAYEALRMLAPSEATRPT